MASLDTRVVLVGALFAVSLAGCRGQKSEEPPVHPIRNMVNQPRYGPQQRSEFFRDHRTMRPLVPGTIAREMEIDLEQSTGWDEVQETWVLEVPRAVVRDHGGLATLAVRGQDRYDIYCAPCHGITGSGDGMVAQRSVALGYSAFQPPSLHDPRVLHMPDGQIFATVSNGVRNMPAYGHAVPVNDRWAIVTYLRALQISQAAEPGREVRGGTP